MVNRAVVHVVFLENVSNLAILLRICHYAPSLIPARSPNDPPRNPCRVFTSSSCCCRTRSGACLHLSADAEGHRDDGQGEREGERPDFIPASSTASRVE